jgi:serine/threonine protein phosphatase 1
MKDFTQLYVVGDIHGCRELLQKIHNKILETSNNIKGQKLLIYLGDYIDRGPDIKGTIQTLIDFQPKNFNHVFLLGNHEQMLLDFIAGKRNSLYIWLGNGGFETLESYGSNMDSYIDTSLGLNDDEQIRKKFTQLLPLSHKNFFIQLQLNYEWEDYFFVHAGINPELPFNKQEKETMIWTREQNFFDPKMIYHKTIVHGHTPVEKVEKLTFRINLDTGAFYSDILTCLLIDVKSGKRHYFNTK